MLGRPVAWAAGRWVDGVTQQQGWVVVRPEWVAFLPTQAAFNLAAGLAGAMVGVHRLEGRPLGYELSALLAHGEDFFDREVQRSATKVWWSQEVGLIVGPPLKGQAAVSFFLSDAELLTCSLPLTTRRGLLSAYRLRLPGRRAARRDIRFMALLSLLPFGLGALGIVLGPVADEPSAVWGAPLCWWPLAILLWVAMAFRWKRAAGLPEETSHRPIRAEDHPFTGGPASAAPGPVDTSPEATVGGARLTMREVMAFSVEGLFFTLATVAFGAAIEPVVGEAAALVVLPLGLLAFLAYSTLATSRFGGTLLLGLLKLRVAPEDGERHDRVGPLRALARSLLLMASLGAFGLCFPFGPIALFVYRSKRGRFPHDALTRTRLLWR